MPREFEVAELKSILAESDSVLEPNDAVDETRSWINPRVFQVGMHLLRGNMEPQMSQATFAAMIETSVESSWTL